MFVRTCQNSYPSLKRASIIIPPIVKDMQRWAPVDPGVELQRELEAKQQREERERKQQRDRDREKERRSRSRSRERDRERDRRAGGEASQSTAKEPVRPRDRDRDREAVSDKERGRRGSGSRSRSRSRDRAPPPGVRDVPIRGGSREPNSPQRPFIPPPRENAGGRRSHSRSRSRSRGREREQQGSRSGSRNPDQVRRRSRSRSPLIPPPRDPNRQSSSNSQPPGRDADAGAEKVGRRSHDRVDRSHPPSACLMLRNIGPHASEAHVMHLLASANVLPPWLVQLVRDKATGAPKGYAFLFYPSVETAAAAFEALAKAPEALVSMEGRTIYFAYGMAKPPALMHGSMLPAGGGVWMNMPAPLPLLPEHPKPKQREAPPAGPAWDCARCGSHNSGTAVACGICNIARAVLEGGEEATAAMSTSLTSRPNPNRAAAELVFGTYPQQSAVGVGMHAPGMSMHAPGMSMPAAGAIPGAPTPTDSLERSIKLHRTLWLSSLSPSTTSSSIRDSLVPFAAIEDVKLLLNETGSASGNAFVELETESDARRLLSKLTNKSEPFLIDETPVQAAMAGGQQRKLLPTARWISWVAETTARKTKLPARDAAELRDAIRRQRVLFLTGLHAMTTPAAVRDRLAPSATIADVKLILNDANAPTGTALVEVNDDDEAKKLISKLTTESFVVDGAPVQAHLAAVQQVQLAAARFASWAGVTAAGAAPPHPAGLAATFVFDASSGYWFDEGSGYYFDATSNLYYHGQSQTYSRWDPLLGQFVLADTLGLPSASTPGGLSYVAAQYFAMKTAQALHQQQQQQQSQTPSAAAAAPLSFSFKPSAAAAALKSVNIGQQSNAAAAAVGAAAAPAPAAPSPSSFLDMDRRACLLCHRQLKRAELLLKHAEQSELHKKNLADWLRNNPQYAAASAPAAPSAPLSASNTPAATVTPTKPRPAPASATNQSQGKPLSAAEQYKLEMQKYQDLDRTDGKRPLVK